MAPCQVGGGTIVTDIEPGVGISSCSRCMSRLFKSLVQCPPPTLVAATRVEKPVQVTRQQETAGGEVFSGWAVDVDLS